jgi:NADH-quinone oxidoreductase subunit N
MIGLSHFSFILPEFFLGFALLSLLLWGVIFTKLGGGLLSQLRNLHVLTSLSLILTFILLILEYATVGTSISLLGGILSIDPANMLIKIIITIFSIFYLVISRDKSLDFEFYILFLLGILGMFFLVSSNDLLMMYLSIETLSLSLYVLAAFNRSYIGSAEAGLKYFILGALASGLLIAGSVIIYMITGETSLSQISLYIWYNGSSLGLDIGGILILVALLFKLGAAPFHMWVPDVYDGSPTYVTAYFAILPKIATLGILYKFLNGAMIGLTSNCLQEILIWCGLISIIIGSIGAINQTKIKRLLAYSAIAHMGFMLLGIGVGTIESYISTIIYVSIYMIMSLNTFSIVLNKGWTYINEFSGISRKEPILALTLGLSFFSIAGIPPLAGFYSKYVVLITTVESGLSIVAGIAVLASVIGGFYYLRIVKWIYFNDSPANLYQNFGNSIIRSAPLSYGNAITLGVTFFLTLTLWVFPSPILEMIFTGIISSSII